MKHKSILSRIYEILLLFLFVYLLIFPKNASAPTRSALEFCARTLVPSLFIYTVLSKTVFSSSLVQSAARRFGIVPITLVIGTLCGCPIGAKLSISLYESRRVDKRFAEYLCSFSNNASASFVLGFIGSELFGDALVGVRLLVYQLIASVITAAVMKRLIFGRERLPKICASITQKTTLSEAISDGGATVMGISACAMFFIVVSNAISSLLPLSGCSLAIVRAILEFSSGCSAAASLKDFAIPVTAFALGHCGASVAMQVRAVTGGRLSLRPYLTGKIISGTVMTVLAIIFG